MKLKEASLLSGILLIAFSLRITTYKYYLMKVDPFHHFAIARHIVETGNFPGLWPLSLYPDGGIITEPMGLYYVSVLLHRIATMLLPGLSFLAAFKLATPLFGALTLIPTYLLAKHMFNTRTGFYTIAILAVLPASIYRSLAGFYRGDAFSVFFMVLGFYLFMLSLDGNRKGFVFLAGASFGIMGLVWNGFLFGFVVLSGFTIFSSLINYLHGRSSRNLLLGYAVAAGLGIAIIRYSTILQPHVLDYVSDLMRYIYPSTLLVVGISEVLGTVTTRLDAKRKAYTLFFVAAASAVVALTIFPEFLGRLATGYGLVQAATPLFKTISELQPPTLADLWIYYHLILLLFPMGLYFLRNRRSETMIFMLIWTGASLFLLKWALRYTYLASIPIAMLAGLFLANLDVPKVKKGSQFIALLLVLSTASHGITISSEITPRPTASEYNALNFLKGKDQGGVLSWWDYGSWVQGVAGFPTVVDTVAGQDMGRITEIGKFFLETNESKTLELLRKYRVKYVLVSTEMLGQMHNINSMLGIAGPAYVYFTHNGAGVKADIPVDSYGRFSVYKIGDARFVTFEKDGKLYAVKNVYRKEKGALISAEYPKSDLPFVDGAVYISENDLRHPKLSKNFLLYIPPELEGTLLTSLLLLDGEGFSGYGLIYSNPEVKIYSVDLPPTE